MSRERVRGPRRDNRPPPSGGPGARRDARPPRRADRAPTSAPRRDDRAPRRDDRAPPRDARRDDRAPPREAPPREPRADDRPPGEPRADDRPPPPARRDAGPVRGPGERLVYGAGPVRELVMRRPDAIRAIWVDPQRAGRSTSDPIAAIVVAARAANLLLEDRDRATLDRAAGEHALHQGVVAWLGEFRYAELEALIPVNEPALIIALDGVEDPRNLGAILRSAYLLGAHGVVIPSHRAAAVTSVTAKASAGASELVPVAQVPNLVRALEELREAGLWRVAVHATERAQPIDSIDFLTPTCLVLGAEGSGVRPLVAEQCDFHALIPMARTAVGSFNVSVAAALALYEVSRQRTRTAR